MDEFFDLVKPTTKKVSKTSKATKTCKDCGLYDTCLSPRMSYIGEGKKKILVIGDVPSREDDKTGYHNSGTHMVLLKKAFKELGYSLTEDCWYITTLQCRPPRGEYKSFHVGICASRLLKVIDELKPKAVLLLGECPFDVLIYPRLIGRIKGTSWTEFVGECIPDQTYQTYFIQTNDPAHLLSTKKWEDGQESDALMKRDPSTYVSFKRDIERAYDAANSSFYTTNYKGDCLTTQDEEQAISWILEALEWKKCAYDYETTGKKPHRQGHKIIAISISNGFISYSFPFFNTEKFKKVWRKFMLSDVAKIAHNMQFEMLWTKVILGYWPKNLIWDTMLGQHVLNNWKPTGLKFCTYVSFGDIGYDDSVAKYMEPSKEETEKYGANGLNTLDQAPIEDVLLYNALDSYYTYKLYERQIGFMPEHLLRGYSLLHRSSFTLVKMQDVGVSIDPVRLEATKRELQEKLDEAENIIMSSNAVSQWDREEPFNHKSTSQLAHLLFDILKVKPLAFTPKGKPSVDKDNLPRYNVPLVQDILTYRKYDKLLNTSVNQYLMETINNKVHCFTNLNSVDSYRSSMNSVNLQQNPKRDKIAKQMLRSFVVADRGCRLVECDHSQLEVRINACYSGDKNLIDFIVKGKDMHSLSTQECFLLKPEEVKPDYRNAVKGMFVFAEFYGSYYAQVAKDLWEFAQSNELRGHLIKKGITRYNQFEELIEEAEKIFWKDRFPQHAEWRKDMWKFYKEHGYIESFTGFRLRGPMQRNNSFNGQVQGSAFHLLLEGLNYMQDSIEEKLERSKLLFEVHDAVIASVHPSEEAIFDYQMWLNCTQKVRENNPWVIVPLIMEKERSAIDGCWAEMEKCGILKGE